MVTQKEQPPLRNGWHIAREIPITTVLVLGLQTVFFAIWLANLSSAVNGATGSLAELKADRYTKSDAVKDRELMDLKFASQTLIVSDLTRRMVDAEGKVQQMLLLIDGKVSRVR